jgi:hypothetical protein
MRREIISESLEVHYPEPYFYGSSTPIATDSVKHWLKITEEAGGYAGQYRWDGERWVEIVP